MGQMDFAFDTLRLRVFEASVTPWSDRPSSTLYLAFLKEAGPSQSVGHAIVTDQRTRAMFPSLQWYCEVIEVSIMFRGNGYGQELFLGIEGRLGAKMAAIAVTPEGVQFLTKLNRPTDSLAAVIEQMFAPLLRVPGVESKLHEEARRLSALPAAQNPGHPEFHGDRFHVLITIAPISTLKSIITAKEMPLQQRLASLHQLMETLCPERFEGSNTSTAAT